MNKKRWQDGLRLIEREWYRQGVLKAPSMILARSSIQRPSGPWVLVVIAALLVLGAISPQVASAQAVPQPILTTQFSFSNPGARSLGLGGAFVALADDATAAWANPAGLVQIMKPEISAEARYWSYSTPFVAGGRVDGEPTGIGLDTTAGVRTGTSEFDTTGLAFLSFVYPGNRWCLAVYRHVLANLQVVGETEGLFTDDGDGGVVRFLDQRNHSVMDVISYGVSGAYRLSDSFSVGAGLVYYDTSFEIQSDLYFWDDLDDPMGSGTSYLPEHFVLGQTLFGDDQSFGLSAGILWRISQRWSVGGRYRQGPEARMSGQARAGSILDLGVPPGTVIDFDFEAIAEMPDNYGIGTAYRSNNGRLTIGFEWDRVTYSKTPESLELDDQTVDDADQLHLGAEWVFLQSRPLVAIRAGIWHEPDHQTRANDNADDFTRAHLRPGDDQLHYALGVGIALKNFQVDGALDFSDAVNTGSLSVIFSF